MPLIDVHGAALEDSDAVAVQLAPDAKLDEIAPRLGGIGRIEIEFPKFRDGRGFTLARTLRTTTEPASTRSGGNSPGSSAVSGNTAPW